MRRTPGAILLGTLGFGLFVRAAANCQLTKLGAHTDQIAPPPMKAAESSMQTRRTSLSG